MKGTTLIKDVQHVCAQIEPRLNSHSKLVVGIAGPPASGKSTLAEAVVAHLNKASGEASDIAILVPMDGYHLDNGLLETRGLLARKGAPETFNATGFCNDVAQIKTANSDAYFPCFDRSRDIAIANAICVPPEVKVVVVEGNYLLLKNKPWVGLKDLFAVTVFLSPGLEVLKERLQRRWIDHGLSVDLANERTTENDLPNAELVLQQSAFADIVLTQI